MHSDRKAHEEGDKHYPAGRSRLVRLFIPLCHCPEYQGGKQGGHRIHLALYRREPECIRETVCQSAYSAASEYCKGLRKGISVLLARKSLGEEDYGKIQEVDCQSRAEGAHHIDGHGCAGSVGKHGEETRNQLEHRVSWRVAYFQLI